LEVIESAGDCDAAFMDVWRPCVEDLARAARDDIDRRASSFLARVHCSRCKAVVSTLVAAGFGWRRDVFGRPGVGLGYAAVVCNWCVDRLVDPLQVERREWFAEGRPGDWYIGQAAYESQFAGACTLIARFAPGTPLSQMRLPDTGTDNWFIERADATAVVARADCF